MPGQQRPQRAQSQGRIDLPIQNYEQALAGKERRATQDQVTHVRLHVQLEQKCHPTHPLGDLRQSQEP